MFNLDIIKETFLGYFLLRVLHEQASSITSNSILYISPCQMPHTFMSSVGNTESLIYLGLLTVFSLSCILVFSQVGLLTSHFSF